MPSYGAGRESERLRRLFILHLKQRVWSIFNTKRVLRTLPTPHSSRTSDAKTQMILEIMEVDSSSPPKCKPHTLPDTIVFNFSQSVDELQLPQLNTIDPSVSLSTTSADKPPVCRLFLSTTHLKWRCSLVLKQLHAFHINQHTACLPDLPCCGSHRQCLPLQTITQSPTRKTLLPLSFMTPQVVTAAAWPSQKWLSREVVSKCPSKNRRRRANRTGLGKT